MEMCTERAVQHGLLLMPGRVSMPDSNADCPYLRLSFSTATGQDIEEVKSFRI